MNIKFHCPYYDRLFTSDECRNVDETPVCASCTSEMDASRKALYDWLMANYADRYQITMKPDGIEIIVHERMRVIADPCDENEDTYLGVVCGDAGDTHSHPFDMQQDVAALLDGRMVVGLLAGEFCSCMWHVEQFKQEPDQLNEWETLVDAEGCYTPEEYARKLGVTLPKKEMYFDCSVAGCRVAESECVRRSRLKEAPCGGCSLEPLNRAAVEHICIGLMQAGTTSVKIVCSYGGVSITVHEALKLTFKPEGMDGDGYLSVNLQGRVSTHAHPTGREALEMLRGFLTGRSVLILGKTLLGEFLHFAGVEELREDWRRLTRGRRVWIADLRGVWERDDYRADMLKRKMENA